MSGFAAIGLHTPQCIHNVGGALRAIDCYRASLLVIGGTRFARVGTDTTKAWRRVPVLEMTDVMDGIPYDCVPVAVDLVPNAVPLFDYEHPKRAFYVFGPEHGTLGDSVLSRCRDRVMVPTNGCMNLAATVNVVLYARAQFLAKRAAEVRANG